MILLNGVKYKKARRLDIPVINVDNYFTVLPISDLSYRKIHPTKARAELVDGVHHIYDDWGMVFNIEIKDDTEAERMLIIGLEAQELI